MRKLIFLTGFLLLAPITFFTILIYLLYSLHQNSPESQTLDHASTAKGVAYASLPSVFSISKERIEQKDARVELVRQFLTRYRSPLKPYAQDIVASGDLYGLDYRLLPAIAMQESNLCKKAPQGSHNCWGFGIYNKQVRTFSSYPEAIETISAALGEKYKNLGLKSPEEIMTRYAPSNNGSWAASVNHFMAQLQ